ncbi:hypothetical protein BLNAU_5094 [Blattamonas nauphoetae]|uniref:Uncharacterized protein n=1 Tax=Blattamonas nauphoetae TaxID=2049346 RepID=A0ABQ9Y801_9EUKA|nr:hypothetical protein BLNAU_5090 [Blattamonas nauphoetae]KAK2959897.1 hypothetical protein BLNAU_5094 [Blattamonas nauphoetae]
MIDVSFHSVTFTSSFRSMNCDSFSPPSSTENTPIPSPQGIRTEPDSVSVNDLFLFSTHLDDDELNVGTNKGENDRFFPRHTSHSESDEIHIDPLSLPSPPYRLPTNTKLSPTQRMFFRADTNTSSFAVLSWNVLDSIQSDESDITTPPSSRSAITTDRRVQFVSDSEIIPVDHSHIADLEFDVKGIAIPAK